MQALSLVFALSLLALHLTIGSSLPFDPPATWQDWPVQSCISDAQAADFVAKIHSLYHCMEPSLAEQTLTPDFHVYSYSMVREPFDLIPDGQEIYAASRDEFIEKGLATKPTTCGLPATEDYKIWNKCDVVVYWWSSIVYLSPSEPHKFIGIDVLEIDVGQLKVKAEYSEYSY